MNDFLARVAAQRDEEMSLARKQKAKDKKAERKAQAADPEPVEQIHRLDIRLMMERREAEAKLRRRGYGWLLDRP